jgi:uncharacterized protein with NAD-binding domain and iron-sulfur cluster
VTAAFELTRPEHQGRYEVTLYQLGWRMGGKGASGRGPSGRIEEHGLHLWMGFYENAFRVMRECYAELGRDPARCPIADWRDAFVPDHYTGIADWSPSGRWIPWRVNLPPFEGMPGDPGPLPPRLTVADYLVRTVAMLRTVLDAVRLRAGDATGAPHAPTDRGTPDVLEAISRLMKLGQLATFTALMEALGVMELALTAARRIPDNVLLRFHDAVATAIRAQLDALIQRDDEARRLWEIIDLVLAVVRGCLRARLVFDPRGFEAIDDYDCRDWLRFNGASEAAVNSAFVRALYDLAFAYEDGDVARPRIAAGQSLRGALRAFFTYRGAFFWKMQAGMGDIVFAPFYEVLKARGVRFEFFHRLESLKLCDVATLRPGERPYIEALEFDVQARVKDGAYEPLVDVGGLPCWPSEPDWAQLVDGERLRDEGVHFESAWDRRRVEQRTLRVGEDFDFVALCVGVGAVKHVARELVAHDPRWAEMVERVKSVPTQAFQIWLDEDMKELGWTEDPINLSGFVEPFDTWADMTHLARRERWDERSPRAIAYFCSVLRDAPESDQQRPTYPAERGEEVRSAAVSFLDRDIVALWPRAIGSDGQFRWELLATTDRHDPRAGAQRFETQFWTANVNPTDRYTLSLPGTLRSRISPLDNTYDNLTIAGDWTDCGFNEGCVEAAVMSGRLAAHALSGFPRLDEIHGYDHP